MSDTAQAPDPRLVALERWNKITRYIDNEARYIDPNTGEVHVGVKAIAAAEMAIRKEVFAHFFPAPKEGANTVVLPGNWRLTATHKVDRKVDPAALESIKKAKVKDHLETLKALGVSVDQLNPEALVLAALNINPDVVLKYTPEVNTKPYKELTAEQRAVFDLSLTTKPGSPALEIKPPAAVPQAAAGLGG